MVVMSKSSSQILPELIESKRRIIFPIVLFPLPLSPIKETISPSFISKLTSLTACSSFPPKVPTLYTFETFSSLSIAFELLPARHEMASGDFDEGRLFGAYLEGKRATFFEPAPAGRIDQRRWISRN